MAKRRKETNIGVKEREREMKEGRKKCERKKEKILGKKERTNERERITNNRKPKLSFRLSYTRLPREAAYHVTRRSFIRHLESRGAKLPVTSRTEKSLNSSSFQHDSLRITQQSNRGLTQGEICWVSFVFIGISREIFRRFSSHFLGTHLFLQH